MSLAISDTSCTTTWRHSTATSFIAVASSPTNGGAPSRPCATRGCSRRCSLCSLTGTRVSPRPYPQLWSAPAAVAAPSEAAVAVAEALSHSPGLLQLSAALPKAVHSSTAHQRPTPTPSWRRRAHRSSPGRAVGLAPIPPPGLLASTPVSSRTCRHLTLWRTRSCPPAARGAATPAQSRTRQALRPRTRRSHRLHRPRRRSLPSRLSHQGRSPSRPSLSTCTSPA